MDTLKAILQRDSFFQIEGFLSTDSIQNFVYQSYDQNVTDHSYLGNGGLQVKVNKGAEIFSGKIPEQDIQTYVFSIWMYINADLYPRTDFSLIELEENGGELQRFSTPSRMIVKTIDNNGWALLEYTFQPKSKDSSFKVIFRNEALKKESIYLDELLIRPANLKLYQKTPAYIWENNRWFPIQ